jgi:multidrug transporter EmrE-like cation transporter
MPVLAVVMVVFVGLCCAVLCCAVTKSLSGAARATIDACRTLFIWLYAVFVGWESFHALEVVGFVVLICGTSLYNEILKSCLPGQQHSYCTCSQAHQH